VCLPLVTFHQLSPFFSSPPKIVVFSGIKPRENRTVHPPSPDAFDVFFSPPPSSLAVIFLFLAGPFFFLPDTQPGVRRRTGRGPFSFEHCCLLSLRQYRPSPCSLLPTLFRTGNRFSRRRQWPLPPSASYFFFFLSPPPSFYGSRSHLFFGTKSKEMSVFSIKVGVDFAYQEPSSLSPPPPPPPVLTLKLGFFFFQEGRKDFSRKRKWPLPVWCDLSTSFP